MSILTIFAAKVERLLSDDGMNGYQKLALIALMICGGANVWTQMVNSDAWGWHWQTEEHRRPETVRKSILRMVLDGDYKKENQAKFSVCD